MLVLARPFVGGERGVIQSPTSEDGDLPCDLQAESQITWFVHTVWLTSCAGEILAAPSVIVVPLDGDVSRGGDEGDQAHIFI